MRIPVVINADMSILHRIILKCDSYEQFAEAFKKIYTQVYMYYQTEVALRKIWKSHPKTKILESLTPIIQRRKIISFSQVLCFDIYNIKSLVYEDGKIYAITENPEDKIYIWDIHWRREDLGILNSRIHKMIINENYAN